MLPLETGSLAAGGGNDECFHRYAIYMAYIRAQKGTISPPCNPVKLSDISPKPITNKEKAEGNINEKGFIDNGRRCF